MKIELITAEILGSTVYGLDNIVTAMYYEGVDMSLLNNGRTIYVYGDGTYEIA